MKYFIIGLFYVISFSGGICIGGILGTEQGKANAYEKIISEECWLDKETRDIICIEYVAK